MASCDSELVNHCRVSSFPAVIKLRLMGIHSVEDQLGIHRCVAVSETELLLVFR